MPATLKIATLRLVALPGNGASMSLCNDLATFTPDAYATAGADTLLLDIINQMGTRK